MKGEKKRRASTVNVTWWFSFKYIEATIVYRESIESSITFFIRLSCVMLIRFAELVP